MAVEIFRTDEEYLKAIKEDDSLLLKSLYKQHYPMILNFVLNNSGDEDEAQDLYQDGFIAFYEQSKKENFILTCKIKTYLYSICRRLWLKKLSENTRLGRRVADDDEYVDLIKDEPFLTENDLKYEVMSLSMEKLGEPCKTLIEDFYIHHMNMIEIADKFGYTNSENAKTQKYKCLQRLKKLFFNDYKGQEGDEEF